MSRVSPDRFLFKQFAVRHTDASMKVGTDAVLLGSWADAARCKTVLDVGTGSGVLALLIAQRTGADTSIDAIDIQESGCRQAEENVRASPWPEKVCVHHTSLQQYQPVKRFDLIICNPPYFRNSLLPPKEARAIARHSVELNSADMLAHSHRLLSPEGRIAVIMPASSFEAFSHQAEMRGLFPRRLLHVRMKPDKNLSRVLVELVQSPVPTISDTMVLLNRDGSWSEPYINLTKDYYLNL